MNYKFSQKIRHSLVHVFLIVGLVITMAPFVWMISTSFNTDQAIFTKVPQWIPKHPTIEQYTKLFSSINFLQHFKNSVVIAVSITFVSLFFNSLAGYAFAKYRFPGKEKLFTLLLATMMIPGQVTMMPVFLILKNLGLLNTYLGLIIPAAGGVFGVFLMKQFMLSIPNELIESARMDGCSEFRIYWQIILPLSKPVLATLGIFTFMGTWNDFLWPLIVMIREEMYTLPVALANLNGQHSTEYALLMAGAVIVIAPIVLLFLLAQKYIIQGIATSGLKE
ncbi:MAG: carbohydrate ABC transporter permease [Endomicrobiales bacterium]|nr:carbohydrate ABC transporter permease [Endomicrobiales bacterium]